ncbi:MAG: Asp-tRNA(Asn)/Glu-tRNA(Gln) amidotransferase subunit GatA [Candidatus Liptonbacteria bacterium]
MEFKNLTLRSFHEKLRAKEFSALEATQAYLKRIRKDDPEIQAFLRTRDEKALQEAEAVDLKIAKGERIGPLAGAPIALKDNMLVEGEISTAASKILEHYTASYDGYVVSKLKSADAVLIGKTNLDEFAMGSSTENSSFQVTKNPLDKTRVAGGSSGGSAAAVAAGMALGSLGSDTGGSIRLPAAFCGVVGLKPTYGAVSRSGLIALASSLDQIGPFAKTVEDAATIFQAIAGYDNMDSTSVDHKYDEELIKPDAERLKELVIGIPDEYFIEGIEPEVAIAVQSAIKEFEKMGIATKRISLPHTKYALSCYYIILPPDASSNLARCDGIRYSPNPEHRATNLRDLYFSARGKGFGPEPKRRIILGTFVLSAGYYDAYYGKAVAVTKMISHDFEEAYKDVDVILTPIAPSRAFKIGEKADDPLAMYLTDIFTIPVNLAGLPGISIPVKGIEGLPIGFQLIGRKFREVDILGLGQLYQKN